MCYEAVSGPLAPTRLPWQKQGCENVTSACSMGVVAQCSGSTKPVTGRDVLIASTVTCCQGEILASTCPSTKWQSVMLRESRELQSLHPLAGWSFALSYYWQAAQLCVSETVRKEEIQQQA